LKLQHIKKCKQVILDHDFEKKTINKNKLNNERIKKWGKKYKHCQLKNAGDAASKGYRNR